MEEYGMTDEEYAELLKAAVNLASVETNLGNNKRYWTKGIVGPGAMTLAKIAKSVWNDGKALEGDYGEVPTGNDLALSRGLTQIKYESDIKNPELKALYDKDGITFENLDLPEKSALATLARLKFNDKFINPKTRWAGGKQMDEESRRQLYWKFGRLNDLVNPEPGDERYRDFLKHNGAGTRRA